MGDIDPDSVDAAGAETTLEAALRADPAWTMPVIISVFLFMLLYVPCMVTVVTIAKESSWKWALFSVLGSITFAYVIAVSAYQVLSRLM